MRTAPAVSVVAAATLVLAWFAGRRGDGLVVYCAHDVQLAEPILDEFTARTGIALQVVWDTEAAKTLGLVQRIVAERDAPRCDVLWCNEPLGVLHLQELGLLAPHRGSGFDRIPAAWKDPDGHWVGFAARLRTWITEPNLAACTSAELEARLENDAERSTLAQFALAVPLYGTTRFHVTALWALRGETWTRAFLQRLRAAGARFVRGNAAVRDLVAGGLAALGWTDTDDASAATAPVGTVPVEVDGNTLVMPNAVAIVRGARQRAAAEALVDHLLAAGTELALAHGPGRQVPLGPVDAAALPADVAALLPAVARALPLARVRDVHGRVLDWLAREWVRD